MTAAPAALGTVAPGFELVREAYTHGWLADALAALHEAVSR